MSDPQAGNTTKMRLEALSVVGQQKKVCDGVFVVDKDFVAIQLELMRMKEQQRVHWWLLTITVISILGLAFTALQGVVVK